LFHDGIDAEMCTRFKLGRTIEDAHAYGCTLWFEHEGLDLRCHHLDTTSFGLTGAYLPDRDEHALCIPHGYSQAPRPDLKPAVVALLVSQDGALPLVSKSWDGNTSAPRIFQARAEALISAFKSTPRPRYLVADAQLSCADNAVHLAKLGLIPRIPATRKVVAQVISQARQWDTWQPVDSSTRYPPLALGH
jgi:transposase